MTADPIVREVREIRHEIERQCKEDPEVFYQHVIAVQNKIVGHLVCRRPKPLVPVALRKTDLTSASTRT